MVVVAQLRDWRSRDRMASVRVSQQAFLGVSALLFATSAALTIVWCTSMLGVALAAIEMQLPALARAVPIAVGVVVPIAGALQFTAWKAHHLACCREAPGRGRTLAADAGTAWRRGLRLGLHCSHCCAGLMAILLTTPIEINCGFHERLSERCPSGHHLRI